MERIVQKANMFFDIPLDLWSRVLILVAAVLLVPAFFFPLWEMRIHTNEFPDGLRLSIYVAKLEDGSSNDRDDLLEVNALNHFIGMRPLESEEFVEFKWIPFVLGAVVLLALRVIVFGTMAKLVDLFVFYAYFGIFALWSFYEKLYAYGHNLNPYATLKVEPFTPPMFGHLRVANFDLYGAPQVGLFFLVLVPILLVAAIYLSHATWRKEHLPSRDYVE